MICIPIIGPSFAEVKQQVKEALPRADLLEMHIEKFFPFSLEELQRLKETTPLPMIFLFRKKGHDLEKLESIEKLASLLPDYFDLEHDTPHPFVAKMQTLFPSIKWFISYHNFEKTPDNLEEILNDMPKADLYKMACFANSTLDTLRMLDFIRSHSPFLGISMGEKGMPSRILGGMLGNPWTFAPLSLNEATAPGQIPCDELVSIYGPKRFSQKSSILGLFGNPVDKSIGHYTHNRVMKELSLDAAYVKMPLEQNELGPFFKWAKKLDIKGLSVLMPYKEAVIPFLDEIDPEAKLIGAVNTISSREGRFIGSNTDGRGALNALEKHIPVDGKKIVILGCGGAAKAIIFEAKKRGAFVVVLNRTKEKAVAIGNQWDLIGDSLQGLQEHLDYDILINTTPSPLPIPKELLQTDRIVMDVKTRPKKSPLLEEAEYRNCTLVFGYEMFIEQALLQYRAWFPLLSNAHLIEGIFTHETLKHIR